MVIGSMLFAKVKTTVAGDISTSPLDRQFTRTSLDGIWEGNSHAGNSVKGQSKHGVENGVPEKAPA